MSESYTVVSHDGQRPWKGQRGSFIDHNVTVSDGVQTLQVVVTQRPETPDPQVGSVIYGHLETQEIPKRDGSTFTKTKLKKDQPGPRGGDVAASPSPQAPPVSATPKSADRGGTFDTRSARIERQHSQEMAVRAIALRGTVREGVDVHSTIESWTDWFVRDLDNASPQTPHISSPVRKAGVGVVPSGAAPRRLELSDREASTASKGFFTKLLREKGGSDALRAAFHGWATRNGVLTQQGVSLAIDELQKHRDPTAAARALGIDLSDQSLSTVPVDTEGLPPADAEVEQMAAGQYDDGDSVPF